MTSKILKDLRSVSATSRYLVGSLVKKVSGYEYNGVIVSVFKTLAGKTRYVVENCSSKGMLHIFNEDQLELMDNHHANQ